MGIKLFRVEFASTVFKEERKVGIMLKTRFFVMSLVFAAMLSTNACLLAQATAATTAAPLPSQILTAKKVFISNAGGNTVFWSGAITRPYNEFYAAIQNWGRYEIAAGPADADLVLQISYSDPITGVIDHTLCVSNCASYSPQFKLVLLDTKTQTVLWTFTEKLQAVDKKHRSAEDNFEDAIGKLVGDLKALTAQLAAAAK
jgi:hypothetical protein